MLMYTQKNTMIKECVENMPKIITKLITMESRFIPWINTIGIAVRTIRENNEVENYLIGWENPSLISNQCFIIFHYSLGEE